MPEFSTLTQAFEWFLENVYPHLPSEEKYKLRDAKYDFYKEGNKVSVNRMNRILAEYSDFEPVFRINSQK